MTLTEIEQALKEGHVWIMVDGKTRYWVCRRNGKTQHWKTRPGDFRIPIKAGFRCYAEITHANIHEFVISKENPNV